MITHIDETLATQVVNTVKEVCGQDINFIDHTGRIFASTDPGRIGTFHEIGMEAARRGVPIEVTRDHQFHGTHKGINLPVFYNEELLAVIGISGEPDEVRKYAQLAQRITRLLIREREIHILSRSQADKRHFIIDSLIGKTSRNKTYLETCFKEFSLDPDKLHRILLIKTEPHCTAAALSVLEQKILQLFHNIPVTLHAFSYPGEFLAVIEDEVFFRIRKQLQYFAGENKGQLCLLAGKAVSLYQLSQSYQSALTAAKTISPSCRGFLSYDDLTLEALFANLSPEERKAFLQKTIAPLSSEELQLIRTYFEENMSLTKTSEKLFLHKNTLQYKLNRIAQKSGLNPRVFTDAVLLYLGCRLI